MRKLIHDLRFGADTLEAQLNAPNLDHRFLEKALAASRGYSRWVKDVQHHENRRTMPITNHSSASNTIGYRYTQSATHSRAQSQEE